LFVARCAKRINWDRRQRKDTEKKQSIKKEKQKLANKNWLNQWQINASWIVVFSSAYSSILLGE